MNVVGPMMLLAALSAVSVAEAQTTPPTPPADVASAPAAVPYLPSIADLMTATIQPRHVKLSLAVKAGNWSYAAYELNELRNAFKRIIRTIPVYDQKTNTEALMSMIMPPLDVLGAAIKAQDQAGARAALTALTATCNACHQQTLHRDYIVIIDPKASAFPDQDFHRR
jgi:hypothetical protein